MNKENENTVAFWKAKYEDLNNQYDDFARQSRELEQELEIQIDQSENRIKDLSNDNYKLSTDYAECREKLNDLNSSTQRQINQLQTELAKYKQLHESAQSYIRELEQKNENLTNSNRIAFFSLEEFENKMNEAIEKNALLESELQIDQANKEKLAETVQRLRDEARDLKQELSARQIRSSSIQQQTPTTPSSSTTTSFQLKNLSIVDSSPSTKKLTTENQQNNNDSNDEREYKKIVNETEATTNLLNSIVNGFSTRPSNNDNNNINNNCDKQHKNQNMPQSMRIRGLDIVGAAFNKLTSMESRLVHSRIIKDRRSVTISGHEQSNFNNNGTNNTISVVPSTTNTVY